MTVALTAPGSPKYGDVLEAARQQAVARYDALDHPDAGDLQRVARLATQITNAPVAAVNIITEDEQVQACAIGFDPGRQRREDALCNHTIASTSVLYAPDTLADERLATNPFATGELASYRMYAGAPLLTPDGLAIGSLCVLDVRPHDLTEAQLLALEDLASQVMTTLELRRQARLTEQARATAEAERARAEQLAETATDAYVALDHDGVIVGWNAAAEHMFGHGRDEVLGVSLADVLLPADLRDASRAGMWRLLTTGEAKILGQTMQLRAVHAGGHEVPVECTIWRAPDQDGWRFHAFLRDISARLQAEAERERHARHERVVAEVTALAMTADVRDVPALLGSVTATVSEAFGDGCGVLLVADDSAEGLSVATAHHPDSGLAATNRALLEGLATGVRNPVHDAITTGEVVRVLGEPLEALLASLPAEVAPCPTSTAPTSLICVPLVARGETFGVLVLTRNNGRSHCDDDLVLAGEVAARAAAVIETARLFAELVAAQAATARHERFLATVLNSIPAATAVLDASGIIRHVNSVWHAFAKDNDGSVETCGAGVDYLTVCDAASSAGDAEASAAAAGIRAVLSGDMARFELDYPCPDADGQPRWFTLVVAPLGEGFDGGAVVLHDDITERKLAEEAVRQSEARYERMAANAPGMVYQCQLGPDGSMRFPFVSEGAREIYGLDPDAIMADARVIVDNIHEDDRAGFLATVTISAQFLSPWRWEGRAVLSDTDVRWVRGASRPERLPDGTVHWDGVLMDCTEAKATEALLAEQAELLQLSPNAVIVRDLSGRVTFWSDGAVAAYGVPVDEALGQVTHELLQTRFPVSRDAVDEALARDGRWEGELEHVRADGERIVVHSRQLLRHDATGVPQSILVVNSDVTHRKRAERELAERHADLARSHAELQAADQLKLDLMGMLSHEIGSPLTSIYGHAELLLDELAGDSLAESSLAVITRNVDRLNRMRTEILTMCALDAGALVAEREVVPVAAALVQALAYVGADVRVLGGEDVAVLVSPTHLQHMVGNFLSNAAKYAGGVTMIEVVAAASTVEIRVHDDGPGVPAPLRPRLFDRFVKGSGETARAHGTGLGLYIVRSLAQANGGTTEYEPKASGSVFVLRLEKA